MIWHDIIYLSNEHYCFVSLTNSRGVLWPTLSIYSIPVVSSLLFYIRTIYFIRQQSNQVTMIVKRRQERDLTAIRRIVINIFLLCGIGSPGLLCIAISVIISGKPYPLSLRILWIGVEISILPLAILMISMTPQLKQIFTKRGQQNQIAAVNDGIPMRIAATH